jgi:HK97 gp10 family phage protein
MASRRRTYVEMEGVAALRKALATLNFAALGRAKKTISDSAEDMLGEAQARVPVLSGETYRSLKVIYLDAGLLASVGTAYYKAKFSEYGTIHMPPAPFMGPAWEITRPKYLAALALAMDKAAADAVAARVDASMGSGGGAVGIPTLPATNDPRLFK